MRSRRRRPRPRPTASRAATFPPTLHQRGYTLTEAAPPSLTDSPAAPASPSGAPVQENGAVSPLADPVAPPDDDYPPAQECVDVADVEAEL